ncbi:MAG: hypothetical protein HWN81_13615 [Candidatus Lokiarchaeota archaeon]|nr:hypothetical protein [Candidatus Lokiarchaeota archaeon]
MSKSKEIILPPDEILNPPMGKNFEYIILWILDRNKHCAWSDFTVDASISSSTLSGKLRMLMEKQCIVKSERNQYKITPSGRKRLNELSLAEDSDTELRYPPEIILNNQRNYRHWILWMVYNNSSCKWSDFLEEPLSINQSSLSKKLRKLIEEKLVINENKEYKITPKGRIEYINILKQYNLDRQSILEEESRRIGDITEKTMAFFEKYKIENDELRYHFLNNALKLEYNRAKDLLINDEDFDKILLFLSINHPDQYPNHISPEDFSLKYKIKETHLKYIIDKIIEEEYFQVKFFLIEDDQNRIYYFQENEPFEKILNSIVEKHITKLTYLNKFQDNPTIDIELLLDNILNDISGNLFNEKLKNPLKNFLQEYIKYLAYKIETEKKLIDSEAKLEGFVWQNIFEEFQTFQPSTTPTRKGEVEEYFYTLDNGILEVLDIGYLSKLNFLKTNEVQETYDFKGINFFGEIYKLLYKNKIFKARVVFEQNKSKLTEIYQLILNDLLTTAEYNFTGSQKITNDIIKKFPKDFIGYLLKSITYFLMDDYDNSLKTIYKGLKEAPNILLFCQKAQVFIKIRRGEEILNEINEKLSKYPNNVSLLRIKFFLYLTHWEYLTKISDNLLVSFEAAIKISPKDKELIILKSFYYFLIDNYKEAKRYLIKEVDFNIIKKNPKIHTTAFFLLTFSYLARGKFEKALQKANQICNSYPNHPISYLAKVLVLGYNLIYKFNIQESDLDRFLELIETTISLEPLKYNRVKYLILKTYVLHGIKQYDEAIDTIDNAISLIPDLFALKIMKTYFLMSAKKDFEILELIEELVTKYPEYKKRLYIQKSFTLFRTKSYDEALKTLDELLKVYPKDISIVNNKAISLGYLGRREEAIETAEYLIKLNPNVGNSYDTFGEIYMILGEYENAIEKYEEALKIQPFGKLLFQTCLKLGICYKNLRMYNNALEYYEKGKLLTERMIPSSRELYLHKAEKYISELKTLMKNTKNKNH